MEHYLLHLDIHRSPPDMIPAGLLIHDPLVLRTTTRLLPREIDQGTGRGDDSTLVEDGFFIEGCDGCVSLR